MRNSVAVVLLAFSLSIASPTEGSAQVIVDYTTSGTVGEWFLDFTVYNNFSTAIDQHVYFWGVMLGSDLMYGSPTGWGDWPNGTTWTNTSYGGSSTVYDTNWWSSDYFGPSAISPGESLGGFVANVKTVGAPTAVNWFAYTYGYTGADGDFHDGMNPGFEGTAFATSTTPGTAVPEPSTVFLLATGLLGIGLVARRGKEKA